MTSPNILIVGEAWGEQEAYLGHPFVGASGRELASLLIEAGILPKPVRRPYEPEQVRDFWLGQDTVQLTNVFKLRPEKNDVETLCTSSAGDRIKGPALRAGRYVRAEYAPHLERLAGELASFSGNLVVCLGGTATWALLGTGGIASIRGAVTSCGEVTGVANDGENGMRFMGIGQPQRQIDLEEKGYQPQRGVKLLPTYHPAAILRDYSLRAITLLDLVKAKREATFPEVRRPRRAIHIEPTLSDMDWFWEERLRFTERIAVDIETQGNTITCIGFAPSPLEAMVVPFRDMRQKGWSFWPEVRQEILAWQWVKKVCTAGIPLLFQNGLYDAHYLWRQAGIPAPVDEDSMLLHHALYPELQKGLGFLGSVYTSEASWKLMNRKSNSLKKDE